MAVSVFVTYLLIATQTPAGAPPPPSTEVGPAEQTSGEPAPPPVQTPQPPSSPQPQYPQPQYPQPQYPQQPPPVYGYPYYPPPGYQGQALPPQFVYLEYERQKKSPGLAFVAEFFIPGLGTAYTERYIHSVITWAGMIVGLAIAVDGANQYCSYPQSCNDGLSDQVWGGFALLIASRFYGLGASIVTANNHNDELLARLRSNAGLSLNVAPLALRQGAGVGLQLVF